MAQGDAAGGARAGREVEALELQPHGAPDGDAAAGLGAVRLDLDVAEQRAGRGAGEEDAAAGQRRAVVRDARRSGSRAAPFRPGAFDERQAPAAFGEVVLDRRAGAQLDDTPVAGEDPAAQVAHLVLPDPARDDQAGARPGAAGPATHRASEIRPQDRPGADFELGALAHRGASDVALDQRPLEEEA